MKEKIHFLVLFCLVPKEGMELYNSQQRIHYSLKCISNVMFEKGNKTEVTSVKLVLFKYVMSFETLTKVDQLTEILRFG